MEHKDKIYKAKNIYILRPSKIFDIHSYIEPMHITGISTEIETVVQTISFEAIPNQVVIVNKPFLNKYRYLPIFEKDKPDDYSLFYGHGHYYDQRYIWQQGLLENKKQANFVGLFENDIIPLLEYDDFAFIDNLDNTLSNRIKYFKFPTYNKLKDCYKKTNTQEEYTLEELKCLKSNIEKHFSSKEERMITMKTYKVIKQPMDIIYTDDMTPIPSRFGYAGTEEDREYKLQKMLNKPLP